MSAWTRGQWALRGVVVLGVLVALLASSPAGAPPPRALVLVVTGLALAHARLPESAAGAGALGLVVCWWAVGVDSIHPAVLVAAVGLLAAHLAALVAAYGPDEMGVDPAVLRRWLLRAGAVLLAAPLLYGGALVLRGRPDVPGAWTVGIVAALGATVLATWVVAAEEEVP
jgi:hypothetical protein